MDGWYYKSFGEEFGPVTFDELVELAKNRALGSDDEVRFGANGNWRRAGSMGQLMAHMPAGSHIPKGSGKSSVEIDVVEGDSWHYKLFGDEFGPVSVETLIELAANQTLSPDDEVRAGVRGSWRRADSITQLAGHFSSVATLPAAPVATRGRATESSDSQGWYYKLFGNEFGPVSFDELIELAKNQTLSVNDDVRFGEGGVWRRAGSIGKLMAHLPFQDPKKSFSVTLDQRPAASRKARASVPEVPQVVEDETEVFDTAPEETETVVETKPVVEDKWWCTIRGKEYGPVPLSKLMEWVANGRLVREDFVRQGFNAYVVAGELPGLFPELPKAVVETKSDFRTTTPTRPIPAAPPSESVRPVTPPVEVSSPPPSMPASNPWQAGGGGAATRPMVPMRRPPAKSGGMDKLLKPILGVVGVVVLGGLIYLILPFLGESADVKRFKILKTAYAEMQNARAADTPPSKDELKKITAKMAKVAKPIETELKGKTGAATAKLRSLAKKMQEVGKEDLSKPTDAEKLMNKTVTDLARILKVK
ncbi:GYF domain-containing protein [Schlesneria sp. T3-172]|uniref:GYF domain-containing protein n=1 Tax=Schlesneria sphaerica TaxID=3373610 RepID=UPI0037C6944B